MTVYEAVLEHLKEGKRGAVATVVNKAGAAPREEGAKMFIGEGGRIAGTIGGGRLEAEIEQKALADMGRKDGVLINFRMNAREVADNGMLCGGDVDILIEPVLENHREVYEKVSECLAKGTRAFVVTRFGRGGLLHKTLVSYREGMCGDPMDETELAELRDFWNEKRVRMVGGDTLVEPLSILPHLYIFGAGHVSHYLAKVARMVDFNVSVIDDRAEFANAERFPDADRVIVADFREVFRDLEFTGSEYVVIVTRGHAHDAAVLEEAVKRPTRYTGMIGSKRKVGIVLDHLRAKGVSEDVLRSVYAPIGIDINSETPQEIAISIVAELIKVRGAS